MRRIRGRRNLRNRRGGGVITAAYSFTSYAATFNATDTYLTITDANISISDSKTFDVSWWMHPTGDGTERVILSNDDGAGGAAGIRIYLDTNDKLNVVCKNAAGTTIYHGISLNDGFIDAMGMCHCRVTGDMSSGTVEILWNGFDCADTPVTAVTNDTIDYTKGVWAIGADGDGTQVFSGTIGELFGKFDATPKDYSMSTGDANHALFVDDTTLRPVDLGSDGSTPYSAQPEIYWKGDATNSSTIVANAGSGGDFTENQPLGSSAVTPDNFVWRPSGTTFASASSQSYDLSGIAAFAAAVGGTFSMTSWTNKSGAAANAIAAFADVKMLHDSSGLITGRDFAITKLNARAATNTNGAGAQHNGFRCDLATLDDANHYLDGSDDTGAITVFDTGNTFAYNASTNIFLGKAAPSAQNFNGDIGCIGADPADGILIPANFYDSTNGVAKWPGRKGENWFTSQPSLWCLLPGDGLRRSRGSRISGDGSQVGTGHPLSPAFWAP